MKKRNINILGVFALLGIIVGSIVLVSDFISLIKGATYSLYGLITLVLTLSIMNDSFEYIKKRIK